MENAKGLSLRGAKRRGNLTQQSANSPRLSCYPTGYCEIAPQGHFLALRAQGATAPAEPRNDKSGSLPHPEGRNDKAGSAPLPCHCEEGVSPTWQSQAGTYESAGAFLCSSQSCEIATAPAEPRNDKSGSLPLNVQKAPRVRRSDCRKSLAEFAPAGAKKTEIIFSGGVYVGENTARLANVRRACPSCAAASRSLFKREPSETGLV